MPSPGTTAPAIQPYLTGFQTIKRDAEALIHSAEDDVLNTAPAPDAWSAIQCLDHLNTAGWLLLTRMERRINDAEENGPFGQGPFRYGFVSRIMIRLMQPSSILSIPAPSSYTPDARHTLETNAVATEFLQLQDDFIACCERSEGLDLRKVRVASPAMPILSISLGAWYEATIAHEQRHLKQARDAVERVRAGGGV
ncbi:DinB family protein [Longibacter sp.]|uniref:DinB family protein n=1 Tax=Longibacter sp. TaxID=2045415 RepID=UPI003EC12F8B